MALWTFWAIIAALALVVSALLWAALVRGRMAGAAPAAYDLRIYRDQLKEVERDLARGVLDPAEAERTRTEVSRRILAADAALRARPEAAEQSRGLAIAAGLVSTLALLGGSLWLYQHLGAPGYDDQALSARIEAARIAHDSRPDQASYEAGLPPSPDLGSPAPDYARLMDRLRKEVAKRPDDLEGHILLARNEAALGNFIAAHQAQAKVIALKDGAATAQDYLDHARFMIEAAGGYISPEAETALRHTLTLEPDNGSARYFLAEMMAQSGRFDLTFRIWKKLLDQGPADAPWIAPIRSRIMRAAELAGVDYTLPEAPAPLAGPDAADVEAASQMSTAEREQMIRSMVEGLSARLADEGGPPAEWARLISAYGVLGETARARAIWEEGRQTFANNPEALQQLREAADSAGVAE